MNTEENIVKMAVNIDIVALTTDNMEENRKRRVAKKGIKIELVKRHEEPYNNMWGLIGGFVNIDEGLEECARRKLLDKTGIEDVYLEQLYTYGDDVNRDIRRRAISVGYIALADIDKFRVPYNQNEKERCLFWVMSSDNSWNVDSIYFINEVTNERIDTLAFDHKIIIADSLNRLRNKLMYTDIGFNLLNEKFTLKELQNVYETILGEEKSGFRALIAPMIEETDEYSTGNAFRPAKLFRKKGATIEEC